MNSASTIVAVNTLSLKPGQERWLEGLFRTCFLWRTAALRQIVLGSPLPTSKQPGHRLLLKMRAALGDAAALATVRGWLADPTQREHALWVYRLRPEQALLGSLLKLAIDPKQTKDPRPVIRVAMRVVFGDPARTGWQMTEAAGRKQAHWWQSWLLRRGHDSRRPDWLKSLLGPCKQSHACVCYSCCPRSSSC